MSLIEHGFVARLKGVAGVTALIGSGDNARIYPGHLPQGVTYPALMYENVSPTVDNDLDGNGLGHDRLRVSAYSPSYSAAKSLETQVRLALHGFKHTTVGGVPIQSIAKVGGRDLLEPAVGKNDTPLHRIYGDYEAWYELATS